MSPNTPTNPDKPVIDVHLHPYDFITTDQILFEMEKAGIEVGVLLAMDTDPNDLKIPEVAKRIEERVRDIVAKEVPPHILNPNIIEASVFNTFFAIQTQLLPQIRISNEKVAALVEDHRGRFIGFGSIDLCKSPEYVEGKLGEVERLGLKGLNMLPTFQFFNPNENPNIERVFKFCQETDRIITYHTGCDPGPFEHWDMARDANPEELDGLLSRLHPKIILAHTGSYSAMRPGIWLEEALTLASKHKNVWCDLAVVPYLLHDAEVVKKMREKVGLDRFLFGSGYPVFGKDIRGDVEGVKLSPHLSEEEKTKILGDNARRLFNL